MWCGDVVWRCGVEMWCGDVVWRCGVVWREMRHGGVRVSRLDPAKSQLPTLTTPKLGEAQESGRARKGRKLSLSLARARAPRPFFQRHAPRDTRRAERGAPYAAVLAAASRPREEGQESFHWTEGIMYGNGQGYGGGGFGVFGQLLGAHGGQFGGNLGGGGVGCMNLLVRRAAHVVRGGARVLWGLRHPVAKNVRESLPSQHKLEKSKHRSSSRHTDASPSPSWRARRTRSRATRSSCPNLPSPRLRTSVQVLALSQPTHARAHLTRDPFARPSPHENR